MRSLIVAALAALTLGLVGAQTAGAAAHWYTGAPRTSFTGSQLTTHTWTLQAAGAGTTWTLSCSAVGYDGLTPSASGTLTSWIFNFHPSSCILTTPPATLTVTPPWCANAWRISLNNNYNLGSTVGTWSTCGSFTFHVDVWNCDITYAYTTIADSVGLTDRNAADTADAPYTSAGGMRVSWNGVPLSYTSTCSYVRTPGAGVFNGTAFFSNVWVGP